MGSWAAFGLGSAGLGGSWTGRPHSIHPGHRHNCDGCRVWQPQQHLPSLGGVLSPRCLCVLPVGAQLFQQLKLFQLLKLSQLSQLGASVFRPWGPLLACLRWLVTGAVRAVWVYWMLCCVPLAAASAHQGWALSQSCTYISPT